MVFSNMTVTDWSETILKYLNTNVTLKSFQQSLFQLQNRDCDIKKPFLRFLSDPRLAWCLDPAVEHKHQSLIYIYCRHRSCRTRRCLAVLHSESRPAGQHMQWNPAKPKIGLVLYTDFKYSLLKGTLSVKVKVFMAAHQIQTIIIIS